MANTIKVDIVSAEEEVWSGEGTMVFAPAEMGEIGIAPQHAPLLTRLKAGEVRVQQESGEEEFFFCFRRYARGAGPLGYRIVGHRTARS